MSVGIDYRVTLSSKKGLRVGGRVERRIIHLLPRVGWLLLPQEFLVRFASTILEGTSEPFRDL